MLGSTRHFAHNLPTASEQENDLIFNESRFISEPLGRLFQLRAPYRDLSRPVSSCGKAPSLIASGLEVPLLVAATQLILRGPQSTFLSKTVPKFQNLLFGKSLADHISHNSPRKP